MRRSQVILSRSPIWCYCYHHRVNSAHQRLCRLEIGQSHLGYLLEAQEDRLRLSLQDTSHINTKRDQQSDQS